MTILELFAQSLRKYICEMDIELTTLDGKDVSPEELKGLKSKPHKSFFDLTLDGEYENEKGTDSWQMHATDPQTRKKQMPSVADYKVDDITIDKAIMTQTASPQPSAIGDWMAKFVLATNANEDMANRVIYAFRPQEYHDYGRVGSVIDTWEKGRESVAADIMLNLYRWFVDQPENRNNFKRALEQMDDDVLHAIQQTFKSYRDTVTKYGTPLDYVENFFGIIQIAGKKFPKFESVNESYIYNHINNIKHIIRKNNALFR